MFLSWLWVVLCSISIFSIVPIARVIQKFVSDHLGKNFFIYCVLAVLATAFTLMVYFLNFRLKIRTLSNYIWLFIIAGLYLYFTLKLWKLPPEAIHFLEYGLLGFFLFKALLHHIRDKSIYFTAMLFGLFVGTFDEIFQWITPRRFWDFRDVGLNALSGALFQLALWKVMKPKIVSGKIKPRSIKILSSTAAVCLVLLGLCASNTPRRVASYTNRFSWLSFLQKEEPMSEFGDKYHDPEIGIFYSRLTLANMQEMDKTKGDYHARVLNNSVKREYQDFLKQYNPIGSPFLHELRVHIFRRDKYFEKARAAFDLNEKKESYFIAYKENLILLKYFTQSIGKSVYSWGKDKIKESEAYIDKSQPYESPVSASLFTSFSEKGIWIAIAVMLFLLAAVNFIMAIRERKSLSI